MYLIFPRQDNKDNPQPSPNSGSGMPGWGIFFLTIFLLLIVGFSVYVVYVHMRARRLGLPSPSWKSFIPFMNSTRRSSSSRPSTGVLGFIKSKLPGGRSGSGGAVLGGSTGYTGAAERSRSTRAQFGQLRQDDDEAWDARGYHGHHDHDTELNDNRGRSYEHEGYSGGPNGFGASRSQPYAAQNLDADGEPTRGRSKSRDPPPPPAYQAVNPRIEQVRTMSPRPMSGESFGVVSVKGGRGSLDGERRSIFREDMS